MIDLRSDTVTKPTPAMRRAMADADVGDDVIDVDPTVERLQQQTAEMLGKEAAIFMPSGSMTNQIAIRVHCRPGDEFVCEANCHVYNYEQGAFAQLSGLVAKTVIGDEGILRIDQLRESIRPENDHMCRTRLITIENTHNRAAGRLQPYDDVNAISDWAAESGLARHLDGARLWNAAEASGISERRWADMFDSVSVCFSKGLGAPVGSCLAGTESFIREARRARKLFGGAMRQAGIIAAGALYALENHRDRLGEDRVHAQMLGDVICETASLQLDQSSVDTNIVIFRIDNNWGTATQFIELLRANEVAALSVGPQSIRLVTHLDVSRSDIVTAGEAIARVASVRSASVES